MEDEWENLKDPPSELNGKVLNQEDHRFFTQCLFFTFFSKATIGGTTFSG